MDGILSGDEFSYLSAADKEFVRAFDRQMNEAGYDFGGQIGSGYCWGKHMLIYRRTGRRSQQVPARVYLRDKGNGLVLRMYFSNIDAHRAYIEAAPPFIKDAFTNEFGRCKHDHEVCRFRKTYTIDGELIEKCNGLTFEFYDMDIAKIPDYMALLGEFYGRRRG